jgi:transposase
MSLKSTPIPPIPEETARVARAVFPRGNILMQLCDTLGAIYSDEAFADLFLTHGQPAEAPWRLALITVFQFVEHLTDRQAADAVRSRLQTAVFTRIDPALMLVIRGWREHDRTGSSMVVNLALVLQP